MKLIGCRARRALLSMVAIGAALGAPWAMAALPTGFTETTLARPDGQPWAEAVGLAFAPNGRLFVWERSGSVWVIDAASPLGTRFLDIRSEVAGYRDHGMLGFALHPNFINNGYVYVLYTVQRHHLVNCDSPPVGPPLCGPGYTPGTTENFQPTIGRVARYQATRPVGDPDYSRANGIDADSRRILLGESYWYTDPNQLDVNKPRNTGCAMLHESHGVGSLVFGQDGTLLVSCGDSASYNGVDWGPGSDSYHTQAVAEGLIRVAETVGAYRAQMVDSFNGKLLRIDPDTGDAIPSNPFYDPLKLRSAKSRMWAMGLRNPFRFTLRPGSGSHDPLDGDPGALFVGDVGWTLWEDLNVVQAGGQNFGWPLFEGQEQQNDYYNNGVAENEDAPNPLYNGSTCTRRYFQFRELIKQDTLGSPSWPNPCNAGQQITSADVFVHDRPALDWQHGTSSSRFAAYSGNNAVAWPIGSTAPDGRIVLGAPFPGNSSTGGVWYQGTDFPAQYAGTYFHGEYGAQWIKNFVFNSSNVLTEVRNFGDGLGGIVSLATNPVNGGLYYIAWTAFVKKISYAPTTNVPPNAVLTVDRQYGASPLVVNFDASQTTDANGGVITYTWNFGDGSPTATGITASHTYTAAGITNYTTTLTARDSGGLTATANVVISVNNTPPSAEITSPLNNSTYSILEPTQLALTASLADDQSGPGSLACSWSTILHHNEHSHNDPPDTNCSTTTQITPLGCDSETYFYELALTVTDPQGLATRTASFIYPDCPAQDTTPPTAPSGLDGTVTSSSQIDLGWLAAADNIGVTGYQVERCTGIGCANFALVGVASSTAFASSGLIGSTSYSFRVRATDAAGNLGPYSNTVSRTTAVPPATSIRVNVGGAAYTDAGGNLWSADTGFNTGSALGWPASTVIAGTSEPTLYQTERWDEPSAPALTYSFNVPNGTYQVKLHFAENYSALFAVGQRVFGVQVEGVTVIPALDVFAEAGARTALIKTLDATVSDGALNIAFIHNVEDPFVNAIEVYSVTSAPDTTAPSTPVLAVPTVVSPTQIDLAWSASTDAVGVTGYLVERCTGVGCSSFVEIASVSAATTSLGNTGLTAATAYSYRVRATDAAGNISSYSDTVSATTQSSPDTTPPTAPVLAAPSVISATQINLSWSASTDAVGVTGYRVERCTGIGCTTFAQIGTSGTTTYSSTSLTASAPYSFRVRATDAAGNLSSYSNVASATTLAPPAVVIRVNVGGPSYTDSAANTWLADAGSNTGTGLSWPASTAIAGTSDPTLYRTERWDAPSAPVMTYSFTVPSGSYQVKLHFAENYAPLFAVGQRVFGIQIEGVTVDAGLDVFAEAGARTALIKTYTTTVADGAVTIAFLHQVEDPFVNAIEVIAQSSGDTTPPTPPILSLPTVVSATQIDLAWGASTDAVGVTGYQVERCTGAGCSSFAQVGTTATTAFSHTGLLPFTSYGFRVRAMDAAGNLGNYSDVVSATTLADTTAPTAPVLATPVVISSTQINLSWSAATDAVGVTGYQIERCQGAGCTTFAQIATVSAATLTYNNTGLAGGTSYSYRVRAADAVPNLSPYSNVGSGTTLVATDITPPTAPALATPTVISATQINLSWSAATDAVGVTGYQIERCQGAGCTTFAQIATVSGATLTYSNTGLTASTSYSYRVRATDAVANFSAYSNTGTGTTQGPPPAVVIRRNVGGPAYTDSAGNVWSADSGSNTGNALAWPASTAIAGTSDPTLYRTERWDAPSTPVMTYSFTVPNGSYQVKLHFAENYSPLFAVGQRVFAVQAEGVTVLPALDVFAEVGARTALVRTVSATVTDGVLNIAFVHNIEDPFVNAIEVTSQ